MSTLIGRLLDLVSFLDDELDELELEDLDLEPDEDDDDDECELELPELELSELLEL